MKTAKLEVFKCRSFSFGFTVSSPKLNGLHIEVRVACFGFRVWSRGESLFQYNNYWG